MANKPQLLFNPDLEPIRYIASNGTFELTLDGKFKTFWLSQKQISELFNLDQSVISRHIKNFREDRPDETTYANFALVQKEGERDVERSVEHYNHNVVIYIGYRAQATDQTIAFQRFVEEVFRQRMEAEHARHIQKIQHQRAGNVTQYILTGKTQSHAEKRVDIKDTFKQLSGIIIRVSDVKMIGQVVSREYNLLFGVFAKDLKRILHTESIRDALPELQLDYLKMVESTLILVLSQKDHLTDDQLMALTVKTITPLAEHLKMICEMAQVDVITGKPTPKDDDK